MPSPYPQERRGRPVPRGRHASDVARVAPYGRDTRHECGHRPAGHHHLRRHGAGPPLRRGALRGAHGNPDRARALAWNRVCGAIDSVFSAGRGFDALVKVFVAGSHFIAFY